MQEGLVELIQSLGYWRVNIRPVGNPSRMLSLAECREIVAKNSVSLRGWDYPHVAFRNDAQGGTENVGDYVQDWCNWYHHTEFWRMYKSSQFLHFKALREDLANDVPGKPAEACLGVGTSIFTMTEIVEFAFRLFRAGLYPEGATVHVRIGNTEGRQLWIDDPMRMGFNFPRTTAATKIEIDRELSVAAFTSEPTDVSSGMLLELFDHFGWSPDLGRIKEDQARFYTKQF